MVGQLLNSNHWKESYIAKGVLCKLYANVTEEMANIEYWKLEPMDQEWTKAMWYKKLGENYFRNSTPSKVFTSYFRLEKNGSYPPCSNGDIIMVITWSIILTGETRWLWNSSWIPLPSAPLTKMKNLYATKKFAAFNLKSFFHFLPERSGADE